MKHQTTLRNLLAAFFAIVFFIACKKDKSDIPPGSTVMVSTYAGDGNYGFANGPALTASFKQPEGVAVDAYGNVFVADKYNHCIRKITAAGSVQLLAGDGINGFADGDKSLAKFNLPYDVAVDANGNVFVADFGNHSIRKITPSGIVSTLAGNGTPGFMDGVGSTARFNYPIGVAVDVNGNVFVADGSNNRIRKISPMGVVSTFAGSVSGFTDGAGSVARFNNPQGVAVDANGNVFVADGINAAIRKISPAGMVSTLAGNGTIGFADGVGSAARFFRPYGVAVDANGNVFVADASNDRIRKINPVGMVSTLAGNSNRGFADGPGTEARFYHPSGVALDANGNIFVTDSGNDRIRKITIQ